MTLTPVLTPTETKSEKQFASYQEYLDLAGDSQIVEWVNGEIIYHMPPIFKHQNIAGFLFKILSTFVEELDLGTVIIAPFEVKLNSQNSSREPDITFVSRANETNLTRTKFEGAPDLIIEIVSRSSVRIDKVDKFLEYERAGVKEYWVIDPRPRKQQVDVYGLNNAGIYEELQLNENGIFHSEVLSGLWFDTNWLWQSPLPNTNLIFADIMRQSEKVPANLRQLYQSIYEQRTQL